MLSQPSLDHRDLPRVVGLRLEDRHSAQGQLSSEGVVDRVFAVQRSGQGIRCAACEAWLDVDVLHPRTVCYARRRMTLPTE
jgi:hypothetical protein